MSDSLASHLHRDAGREATLTDYSDGKPYGRPNDLVVSNKTPARLPDSGADGLAVDAVSTIPVSLQPQNIAFAGPDKKTLYIVGRGSAFKVRLLTAGYAGRAK